MWFDYIAELVTPENTLTLLRCAHQTDWVTLSTARSWSTGLRWHERRYFRRPLFTTSCARSASLWIIAAHYSRRVLTPITHRPLRPRRFSQMCSVNIYAKKVNSFVCTAMRLTSVCGFGPAYIGTTSVHRRCTIYIPRLWASVGNFSRPQIERRIVC